MDGSIAVQQCQHSSQLNNAKEFIVETTFNGTFLAMNREYNSPADALKFFPSKIIFYTLTQDCTISHAEQEETL